MPEQDFGQTVRIVEIVVQFSTLRVIAAETANTSHQRDSDPLRVIVRMQTRQHTPGIGAFTQFYVGAA
ncbi:hypothetical protein D3C77_516050 [compost metagenome]